MITPTIGIFGGSGFYELFPGLEERPVISTPWGTPSDSVFLAEMAGKQVAFMPRHGRHHTIPPHKINYRANIQAMFDLGVRQVIAPYAAGSLQDDLEPG